MGLDTVRVYCAGKIAKNDWRHELFPGLRETELQLRVDADGGLGYWALLSQAPRLGCFEYAGPFFVGCDHGCYHGDHSHGLNADEESGRHGGFTMQSPSCPAGETTPRRAVAEACMQWLDRAGVVFTWINSLTAFGTLFELGYAAAEKQPVVMAFRNEALLSEMWFAAQFATETLVAKTAGEAFGRSQVLKGEGQRLFLLQHPQAGAAIHAARGAMHRTRAEAGHVYLLAAGEYYKIGRARVLDDRLKQLSIQLPHKPRLEHSIKTAHMAAAELFYHTIFARQRQNGEWFRLTREDVEWFRAQETWELPVRAGT